jgi:hypothetical protein
MDGTGLQGFQDLDLLKMYHAAISSGDELLRNRWRKALFERCAKMYFTLAKKVFRMCGLLERAECVGWIENKSWHTGYLSLGIVKGHNAAVEKYHPMPAKLSKIDFEEEILSKTNEQETRFLKSIFQNEEASGRYTINAESTADTFWRRWDIAVRIGFMAAKFSSFAYIICLREMRNYCHRDCMYTAEYREQLRTITPESFNQFLLNNHIQEHVKSFVKNLYVYGNKERMYKLKQEATPAQIRALHDINELYALSVVMCDPPTAITTEEYLVLKQVIALAVTAIEELSLIEQYLAYLIMRDVPQNCAGQILNLSEVNVSRRIRHIEAALAEKIDTALNRPRATEISVALKELRQVSDFNEAYALYKKRNRDMLFTVRKMYILYLKEERNKSK